MSGLGIVGRLRIEPLDRKKHDRAAFTCGQQSLDNYLKHTASRQQDENLTRVRVGCLDDTNRVICFHALNAHSLNITELDVEYRDRYKRYDSIPCAYLSMLGVHVDHQGHSIGSYMMYDAMRQVVGASGHIGVHFLVLDALNEDSERLYLRLGFDKLASSPERMIISTEKIKRAFAQA
jgi:ribosomal protein S18 acetylase RimI-like enzyme